MSCSRSCNFCEAVCDLLTVTMHLQDTLSRFHCPGLHKIDLRVHGGECVDSHPCVSRIPELLSCPCTAQLSQVSICTICSIGLSLRYPRKLHQPAPSARIHQNSNRPWFCFLEDAYTGYHVFSTELLTQNCNSRIAATVFDVSSPISVGHHHARTLRNARNTRNIKIATNDHVA